MEFDLDKIYMNHPNIITYIAAATIYAKVSITELTTLLAKG